MLLSHAHWDHLDVPSLERLGKELPIVCPKGVSGLLRRKKFRHVTTLEVGEDVRIGELVVSAVHAEHEGARGPLGASGELGYVVSGSRRIYFAGDTDLFDDLAAIGPLDLALVPVTGWGSKVGPGHLDPERAAEAVRRLQPRMAVPIHWGTLARIGRVPDLELAARVRQAGRRRGAGGRGPHRPARLDDPATRLAPRVSLSSGVRVRAREMEEAAWQDDRRDILGRAAP